MMFRSFTFDVCLILSFMWVGLEIYKWVFGE